MNFTDQEQEVYDDNVKIYLMALQLLSEKNLLRFDKIDLGINTYRGLMPEKDSGHQIYWRSDWSETRLIVGMICNGVRDSLVSITQPHLLRVEHLPMSAIASDAYFASQSCLWPSGWIMQRFDSLEIDITWNGKEKPCDLVLVNLMMKR